MRRKIGCGILLGIMAFSISGCDSIAQVGKSKEVESTMQALEQETEENVLDDTFQEKDINKYDYVKDLTIQTIVVKKELEGIPLSASLKVVIPDKGTEDIKTESAEAGNYGVTVKVELNPKSISVKEHYPIYEKLRLLVSNSYKSYGDCKNVVISGIEDLSVNTARTTINYIESRNTGCTPHDVTCYMIELSEELCIYINVDIDYDKTTAETIGLVAELEDYYDIDILYDREAVEEYWNAYVDSIITNPQTVTCGTISFELPENWVVAEKDSRTGTAVYCPAGVNADGRSGIVVSQANNNIGTETNPMYELEKYVNDYISQSYGSIYSQWEVTEVGSTFLGDTVMVTYKLMVGGFTQENVIYCGMNGKKISMVGAISVTGAYEDAFAILENIMRNGRMK